MKRTDRVGVAGALVLLSVTMGAAWAAGPCDPTWIQNSLTAFPGLGGSILAMTRWDVDGPGPRLPLLVVAGDFVMPGPSGGIGLAALDPMTGRWSAVGGGVNGPVNALTVHPSNDLVVGGRFSRAGTTPVANIATWNGSTWTPLGYGLGPSQSFTAVQALAVLSNGDLVAGGSFTTAGGLPAMHVARWDRSLWLPMGDGIAGSVTSLLSLPSGELAAGAYFATLNGQPSPQVALWNGSEWVPLGFARGNVHALAVDAESSLIAAGQFTDLSQSPCQGVASLGDSGWTAMGDGVGLGIATSLALTTSRDLVLGGSHLGPTPQNRNIARWNGTSWMSMDSGTNGTVHSLLAIDSGDLLVGGSFSLAGDLPANSLALWGSPCRCPSDLDDGSGFHGTTGTKDGAVTIDDLLFFIAAYQASHLAADLDDGSGTGTRDGSVTVDDLLFFLARYDAGC